MIRIWENVKYFIGVHRVASIASAGVLGVAALGGGGYAAYNAFHNEEPEPIIEVVINDNSAGVGDVYIPEFKNVFITSESIEKDITIYISEDGENCVTGVPFQVKLIKPKDAETLQTYVDAIADLDAQINEYKSDYQEGTTIYDILRDRNVDVTVTDENNQVIETQKSDVESDPLYQLCLDKETAVQAYTVALNELSGNVYTDDDEDGIISEKDMEPGDYMACLINSLDEGSVTYQPDELEKAVNVKDKVEFKVQKEIQKQIKKDVASEDGQKEQAAPVENELKDTQPYLPSEKIENGSKVESTTDAVAPKSSTGTGSAKVKDAGVTSVTYPKQTSSAKIKANGALAVFAGNSFSDRLALEMIRVAAAVEPVDDTNGEKTDDKQAEPKEEEKKPDTSEEKKDDKKDNKEENQEPEKKPDDTKTETDKDKDKTSEEKPKEETTKPATETKYKLTIKYVDDKGNKIKEPDTVDTEPGGNYKVPAPPIEGYTPDPKEKSGTLSKDGEITFTYKKNEVKKTVSVTAELNMSYDKGTFNIVAKTSDASASIGSVKVNDTAITMKDGKGTFKVTKDGDYKLTGVATFSDKHTENLSVTYTVSGFGTASTDKLKDSKGNQLYLDAECKKEATAADYEKSKTYYVKVATYIYHGWQNINGATKYFNANGDYVTGEQVIQGVKYNFGTDGSLLVNGMGIDVSKHQGSIDWAQTAPAVSFAIVRCGYRGQNDGQLHEDPYFYKNMSGAKKNGVTTGIYLYSTALNEAEAVAEASMAVAMANKAGGCGLPIFIDMEDSKRGQSRLTNEQRTAIINAFCTTVQSGGYKAGVYANKTWLTKYINTSSLGGSCYVWVAQYNTECSYSGKKSIWQYSSKGSVPGIKGNVDVNKSYF